MKIEKTWESSNFFAAILHKCTVLQQRVIKNFIWRDSACFYRKAKFTLRFSLGEFGLIYYRHFSTNLDSVDESVGCRGPPRE